jgi:putative aldouronate transport system permease protein
MKLKVSQAPLYLMVLPGVILVLIFSYGPMVGIVMAFQQFIPAKGLFGDQIWVGFDNFKYVLELPNSMRVLWNTLYIATLKIIFGLIVPIIVAILINEVRHMTLKKSIQTTIYLPHFLSWVVLGGILIDILSPSQGIINMILGLVGIEPIFFLGSNTWFPVTLVGSEIWKEFGFGTIIYLAAITGINPELYEAAKMDGANRFKQTLHVTLPGLRMTIVLLGVLSLGNILNAGFDQVFNLYSTQVYESGDIIDTFVYRIGLLEAQYGVATAVGLFKSVVSCILVTVSYYLAYRFANYRIF